MNTPTMNKTNQYWMKVQYGSTTLEAVEIWADSESNALHKAHTQALSKLEIQCETPLQTEYRQLHEKHVILLKDQDTLAEFLYDDIGFTMDQIGQEAFDKLTAKHREQAKELEEVRNQLMRIEIEEADYV